MFDDSNIGLTDIWSCLEKLSFLHNQILETNEKSITFRISVYNFVYATKLNGQMIID